MSTKLLVAITTSAGGFFDVSELTLDELVKIEPRADSMLRAIRDAIGTKINAERMRLDLSLEQIRDMSGREIDSAGLSRLERGLAWSPELATKAVAFLADASRKAAKADKRRNGRSSPAKVRR